MIGDYLWIVITGGITALLTAQGIYAPSEFKDQCLLVNHTNSSF